MKMAEILEFHGDRFAGHEIEEKVAKWIDCGFTVAEGDKWCAIGVWDASTAAKLRDAGVTPEQAAKVLSGSRRTAR